ncbi:MAG TPA: hypothetical protein VKT00_04900 [Casimicrobiaceae bacterium]|nr:hypothetical protein [Casimicrobiaceae bacterium]
MNAAGLAIRPAPAPAQAEVSHREGVQVIESRPGIRQVLLVTSVETARPVGNVVVVLGSGGGGLARNPADGVMRVQGGFAAWQQRRLAEAIGGAVVALSPPTDQPVMDLDWRLSAAHVADLRAAVAWSRQRWPEAAVWMLGFESGGMSAAVAAASIEDTAGAVLIGAPEEASAQQPASERTRMLVILHGSGAASGISQAVTPGRMGHRTWLRIEDERQAHMATPDDRAAAGRCPFGGRETQVVDAVAGWIVTGTAPKAIR